VAASACDPPPRRTPAPANLGFALDFRRVYATVLERWWGLPSAAMLGGKFPTLPLLSA
jgi:uncharacterized protein (DUF1501 family)